MLAAAAQSRWRPEEDRHRLGSGSPLSKDGISDALIYLARSSMVQVLRTTFLPPTPSLVGCLPNAPRALLGMPKMRSADRRVGVNPGTLLLWNGWADFQSEKRTAQRKVRCVRWARPFASAALPAGGVASPSKVHPKVRTLYLLPCLCTYTYT